MKQNIFFLICFLVVLFNCPNEIFAYEFDAMEIQIVNANYNELRSIRRSNSREIFISLYYKIENLNLVINTFYSQYIVIDQDFSNSIRSTFNVNNDDDVLAISIKLYYFLKFIYLEEQYYRGELSGYPKINLWVDLLEINENYIFSDLIIALYSNNRLGANQYFLDIVNFAAEMHAAIMRG